MDLELEPVFARFGACVFVAQVLELDMSVLLSAVNQAHKSKFDHAALDAIFSEHESRPLGDLFHYLRQKEYFTSAEERTIRDAIRKRNELVHNFMVTHTRQMTTEAGRVDVSERIQIIREALEKAQTIVRDLTDKYLTAYSLSINAIVEMAREEFPFDYDTYQPTRH